MKTMSFLLQASKPTWLLASRILKSEQLKPTIPRKLKWSYFNVGKSIGKPDLIEMFLEHNRPDKEKIKAQWNETKTLQTG